MHIKKKGKLRVETTHYFGPSAGLSANSGYSDTCATTTVSALTAGLGKPSSPPAASTSHNSSTVEAVSSFLSSRL
jgi:hypothetical protein